MLDNILIMLGLTDADETTTAVLEQIIEIVSSRLCILLNESIVPSELEYIVVEVGIARYNRIGSEGTRQHTVQGESMNWDTDDDLKPYLDDIQAWLATQDDPSTNKGRLRFI